MKRSLWVASPACALLISVLLFFSDGALLRHNAQPDAEPGGTGLAGKSVAEIKKDVRDKWGQMDEFLETMFMLACKWKHGKDVRGAAAEKLQDGSLEPGQLEDFMKKKQSANVQGLTQACGSIVAQQQGKCRQGCSDRWNKMMEKRSACDKSCVAAYSSFEKSCNQKAEHLESVYAMKLSAQTARKRCFEGHCPDLPTVWMMTDAEKMADEVDTRCGGLCEEDQVQMRCSRKWQLEVDFIKTSVGAKCAEDAKAVECFNAKKDAISQEQSQCASDGKDTCNAQLDECKTKGQVESSPVEAAEFCASRLKMCETQVTSRCLDDHKNSLENAKKACETDDSKSFEKCKDGELQKRMTESIDKCTQDRMPKCDEECHQTCKVDDMNSCLDNLKSDGDVTEEFCTDFWELLHDSSQVDPVTGAPIVLLISKKPAVAVTAQPATARTSPLRKSAWVAAPAAPTAPTAPMPTRVNKPPPVPLKTVALPDQPKAIVQQSSPIARPAQIPTKLASKPAALPDQPKATVQTTPLSHNSAPLETKPQAHTVKIEFVVPYSEDLTTTLVTTLQDRTKKAGVQMPGPGDPNLVITDAKGDRSDPAREQSPPKDRFPLHVAYIVHVGDL